MNNLQPYRAHVSLLCNKRNDSDCSAVAVAVSIGSFLTCKTCRTPMGERKTEVYSPH